MFFNSFACAIFVFYSFLGFKKSPISSFLSSLIALTYFLGIFVGNTPNELEWLVVFNFIFVAVVLFVFCHSFWGRRVILYSSNNGIFLSNFFLLTIVCMFVLVTIINATIVSRSISYVLNGGVNITEFKNQGDAADLIRTWVDPRLVFLSYALSPLSYLALALHFYFLTKRSSMWSIVFLIFALNIPLVGLHALSRSSIVHFVLLYFLLYFSCYGSFSRDLRKKINIFIFFSFSFIFVIFYFITVSRFSESSFYSQADSSLIKNRALYSLFDYGSQWIVNSLAVLGEFSISDMWYGKSTFTAIDIVMNIIGLPVNDYTDVRGQTLGRYASKFNGLVATLVYDFSYVGAVYFVSIFFAVVRFTIPRGGIFNIGEFSMLIVLVATPLMFFSNNYLGNTMYAIGSIYILLLFFVSKLKFSSIKFTLSK
jgi:oligosaccharide repeat unit polymerase